MEPYRLWSLWEMFSPIVAQGFVGGFNFGYSVSGLMLNIDCTDRNRCFAILTRFNNDFIDLRKALAPLPISDSLEQQLERLKAQVTGVLATMEQDPAHRPDPLELNEITTRAKEIGHNLTNELSSHLFYFVPTHRTAVFQNAVSWFGATLDRFPDTERDIRDACQCFGLGQWTAAVFHAMRIVEQGLHSLAGELGATFAAGIELENWKNIIDQIEKAIRKLEQDLPKSQKKSEDLQYYSAAAAQFTYFKNAWRNHVSHSRTSYDEQGARDVLNHVKDFMKALATR